MSSAHNVLSSPCLGPTIYRAYKVQGASSAGLTICRAHHVQVSPCSGLTLSRADLVQDSSYVEFIMFRANHVQCSFYVGLTLGNADIVHISSCEGHNKCIIHSILGLPFEGLILCMAY